MRQGLTLVELVIVLVLTGILFVTTPILVFHGVKTLVFLPKALAVNEAAMEALHQMVEGGFSTLSGQTTVRGLRFAVRRSATEPAIWLAETTRIGFVTSDNQYVLLWLDNETVVTPEVDVIIRAVVSPSTCASVPSATGEILPYHAAGSVRIVPIPPATSVFRYYNQSDIEIVTPGCPPPTTIRRVDIAFAAQTGNGLFDEGNAREDITTSVAIRIP